MRCRKLCLCASVAIVAAVGCEEDTRSFPPPTPPPPTPPIYLEAALPAVVEAMNHMDTVDRAVESVKLAAEIWGSLPKDDSLYPGVSCSVAPGVRGADPRRETSAPPVPPLPSDLRAQCEAAIRKSDPVPCYCLFQIPQKLPTDTEFTCKDGSPPPAPEPVWVFLDVKLHKNVECETYQVKMSMHVPANASLPPQVQRLCEKEGDQLRCTKEMTIAEKCSARMGACAFSALEEGRYTFPNRRFEFPSYLNLPDDLADMTSVQSTLESLSDHWHRTSSEAEKCVFLKSFLKEEKGWGTDIETTRTPTTGDCGPECLSEPRSEEGSASTRPPWTERVSFHSEAFEGALKGSSVEFRWMETGWRNAAGAAEKRVARMESESRTQGTCVPVDLDGIPLPNAPTGLAEALRYAEVATPAAAGRDSYIYGRKDGCLVDTGASEPKYFSVDDAETRWSAEASGGHPTKIRWGPPKEVSRRGYYVGRRIESKCREGKLVTTSPCPGFGEFIVDSVRKFSDGESEVRSFKWSKTEGACEPTMSGSTGSPIRVEREEKGRWKATVTDSGGSEIRIVLEDALSEERRVQIYSGFLAGTISYHAPNQAGIVGEGELLARLPGLHRDMSTHVDLDPSGWQRFRGKVGPQFGKTAVFWVERTAAGGKAAFEVFAQDSTSVSVSPTPETQPGPPEISGALALARPSRPEEPCEVAATGSVTLRPESSRVVFSVRIFEDQSVALHSDEDSFENVRAGCAAEE